MIEKDRTAGVDFVLALTDNPVYRDTKFIFLSNFGKKAVQSKLDQLKGKLKETNIYWFDKPVLTSELEKAVRG